jgi:hypothetical protein
MCDRSLLFELSKFPNQTAPLGLPDIFDQVKNRLEGLR